MALFFPGITECSICGVVVNEDDNYFGTTHFIPDDSHHLWRFSDSIMHKECFRKWPHKDEFVLLHNEAGAYHRMNDQGTVVVTY